ncbi:hypothetical protein AB1K62_00405 [Parasphingorhabdus sp. JC815]|uniref:PAS domain-containing protein n=1 Tax=Parasphingorhabdus sp. JC815 TaxID=3232140 RepID=UPI00345B1BBD
MDNLRNSNENSGLGGGFDPDYIAYEDDDVTTETPPTIGQDERRMHVRAYNYWASLLGERQFPSVEDLTPESDDDFGPNSVLLDFTNGIEKPAIQFLGKSLRQECGLDANITTIDQIPARSLLSRITDHYLQIIANQAPIGFEAEFVNQRGQTIMYRGILLPFSTDDDTIDFIYGVINWKEVVADDYAQELEDQVAEAMRSAPERSNAGPVWADGPISNQLELTAQDAAAATALLGSNLVNHDKICEQPDEQANLVDWLVAARSSADNAAHNEQRSRIALYTAIGQAYDFYLMTEKHPADYAELLKESGLKMQTRAPMTPIVKLVFGAQYDKTRLTEYAAALRYAKQAEITRGTFSTYLNDHEGGLKAIVQAERKARKSKQKSTKTIVQKNEVLERLRTAPVRQLSEIDTGDEEFVVLVARRDDSGKLSIVGPVLGDEKLTTKALKQTSV